MIVNAFIANKIFSFTWMPRSSKGQKMEGRKPWHSLQTIYFGGTGAQLRGAWGGGTCPPQILGAPPRCPPTKKNHASYFLICQYRACVNTLRPHKNHAYAFLKYAYLTVVPPHPHPQQPYRSDYYYYFFFFLGGRGVSSNFSAHPTKTQGPPPQCPLTGKILATPLGGGDGETIFVTAHCFYNEDNLT